MVMGTGDKDLDRCNICLVKLQTDSEDIRDQWEVGSEGFGARSCGQSELSPDNNFGSMDGDGTATSVEGIKGKGRTRWV